MKCDIIVSTVLLLSASVQILLILIAGLNKDILLKWYHLKVTTDGFDVPSSLGSSQFLKDLSTITGTDLVGTEQTAQSLRLAESYTINLFSSCADVENRTQCTSSKFGYDFNPVEDLRLSDTGLSGSFSNDFVSSISYASAARAIAVAYILALLSAVATIVLNFVAYIFNRLIFSSAITSIFATIFQLAASAASTATFINLQNRFDEELSPVGIRTKLGKNLYIASWMAFAILLVNSLQLCYTYQRSKAIRRKRSVGRGKGMIDPAGLHKPGGESNKAFVPPKRTRTLQLIKNKIPFVGARHKYAEIGRQPGVRSITVTDHDTDRKTLIQKGFGGDEDEDDDREELVRGSTRGIAMAPLGGKPSDTAYEPFRHAP